MPRRPLLLSLAIPTLGTGAWASLAPASWYADFPGFGRHWLGAFGPYNEHLGRDFGGALVALGVLLVWTALAPGAPLRRAVPASFLFFALPHFVFHVAHAGELATADDVVNLALLGGSVALPVALLVMPEAPMRVPAAGPTGWRLSVARSRNPVVRLVYWVSRRRWGHVVGPVAITGHHPLLLAGYSTFELALERADRMDRRLEELAAAGASFSTGCAFCIDFATGLLPHVGVPPEKAQAIVDWRHSELFDEEERLVLEYAEAMTATPPYVSDELFERLRARFDEAALVELTAAIALENYRGRFNHAMGLGSEGFCARPGLEVAA